MAIIIIKKGNKPEIIKEKTDVKIEENLREVIMNNPETLPLYEIKEDIKVCIVAREFGVQTGSIDLLGIDKDGEIYIIETKLFKNPDKREVIAQVLDYGASLWGSNFNDFRTDLEKNCQEEFKQGLRERLKKHFEELDDAGIDETFDTLQKNIEDGNFKFVVVMDELHEDLKDIIRFINKSSNFTIYAVELEQYEHKDEAIIIPKLYGAEGKKSRGGARPKASEQELLRIAQENGVGDLYEHLLEELRKYLRKEHIDYNRKVFSLNGKVLCGIRPADSSKEKGLRFYINYWLYENNPNEEQRELGTQLKNFLTHLLGTEPERVGFGDEWNFKSKEEIDAFVQELMMLINEIYGTSGKINRAALKKKGD